MTTQEHPIHALNQMILAGQILEAFDQFYADDVVMQENHEAPRVGKPANRRHEEEFVNSLAAVHAGKVNHVIEGPGISVVDWFFDFEFKNGHRQAARQVAVQEWRDGKIVRERFYYGQ